MRHLLNRVYHRLIRRKDLHPGIIVDSLIESSVSDSSTTALSSGSGNVTISTVNSNLVVMIDLSAVGSGTASIERDIGGTWYNILTVSAGSVAGMGCGVSDGTNLRIVRASLNNSSGFWATSGLA